MYGPAAHRAGCSTWASSSIHLLRRSFTKWVVHSNPCQAPAAQTPAHPRGPTAVTQAGSSGERSSIQEPVSIGLSIALPPGVSSGRWPRQGHWRWALQCAQGSQAGRVLWAAGRLERGGPERGRGSGILCLKPEPGRDMHRRRVRGTEAAPESGQKGQADPRRLR